MYWSMYKTNNSVLLTILSILYFILSIYTYLYIFHVHRNHSHPLQKKHPRLPKEGEVMKLLWPCCFVYIVIHGDHETLCTESAVAHSEPCTNRVRNMNSVTIIPFQTLTPCTHSHIIVYSGLRPK